MNVAKSRGRDCVVRYDTKLPAERTIDHRGDCPTCRTRFSYPTPIQQFRDDEPIRCPNCATPTDRPARPEEPEPEDI